MSRPARRILPRARLQRRLSNATAVLLTLASAASCVVVGPAPPSVLGPSPDIPSVDGGMFPGTGGSSASGGSFGCTFETAHSECRGDELWQVTSPSACTPVSQLLFVCEAGCFTSPTGVASCVDAGLGGGGAGGVGAETGGAGAETGGAP